MKHPPKSQQMLSYDILEDRIMKKQCDCCGRLVFLHEANTDARHTICAACYQRSYTRCAVCGTMIHKEDTYYNKDKICCYSCYNDRFRLIYPHDYKPAPIFYGAIPRFFGVELEIDDGGHNDENARILLDTINTDAEYIYIKTDSSLRDGLEIVTHPMTLDFHLHRFPWKQLLRTAVQLGYHADNTDTCGLHIHVNRLSLGNTPEKQDAAISNLQEYMEAHHDEIRLFSRRKASYWNNLTHAMLNLHHPETVEFRLFQGTLQYAEVIRSIYLVNRICTCAELT